MWPLASSNGIYEVAFIGKNSDNWKRTAQLALSPNVNAVGSIIELGSPPDASSIYIGNASIGDSKGTISLVGRFDNIFNVVSIADAGDAFNGFMDNSSDGEFLVTANPDKNVSNYISTNPYKKQQKFTTGLGPKVLVVTG